MNLKSDLQNLIKGDVLDDEETLTTYSHDASLFEVKPKVVVFPKDAEDVKAVVRWVNENKDKHPDLSITARSAGTDMSGGPLNESIILNFTKYMNRLISFEGDCITVEPGMFYRDFEKETLGRGLLLPSYPASKSICAIGGMVANDGAGEKTLKYGKTEQFVEKLKVILSDGNEYTVEPLTKEKLDKKIAQNNFEGNIYKQIWELITDNLQLITAAKPNVSKNAAGYYIWNVLKRDPNLQMTSESTNNTNNKEIFDLNKLIVGSQGTLCIITEITLKLVPVEKHSKLLVIFLRDLKNLARIINTSLTFNPESFEAYDDQTLKLAIRFWRGFIKKKGLFGFIKMGLSFLPEFFMLLTGGIPQLVLLVEFAGENEEKLEEKLEQLQQKLKQFDVKTRKIKTKQGEEKYWGIRRDSFALLREHVKGKRTAPFIDDFIVKPEFLSEVLPKLNAILKEYPIDYTIAGHAGDGNFHIIPLMDLTKPFSSDIILELSDKVYDLILSYGGSITAEHNDGIIRTPYLEKMYGREIYEIFKKIKNIFDSKNIFNPGKKVGGSKEYIKEHLIKSSKL